MINNDFQKSISHKVNEMDSIMMTSLSSIHSPRRVCLLQKFGCTLTHILLVILYYASDVSVYAASCVRPITLMGGVPNQGGEGEREGERREIRLEIPLFSVGGSDVDTIHAIREAVEMHDLSEKRHIQLLEMALKHACGDSASNICPVHTGQLPTFYILSVRELLTYYAFVFQ